VLAVRSNSILSQFIAVVVVIIIFLFPAVILEVVTQSTYIVGLVTPVAVTTPAFIQI
jgi:hypothetical protein